MENAHLEVPRGQGRAVEAQEPAVLLLRVVRVHVSRHFIQYWSPLASQQNVCARLMRLQVPPGGYQVYLGGHCIVE